MLDLINISLKFVSLRHVMFVPLQVDSNYISKNLLWTYGEVEEELQAFFHSYSRWKLVVNFMLRSLYPR